MPLGRGQPVGWLVKAVVKYILNSFFSSCAHACVRMNAGVCVCGVHVFMHVHMYVCVFVGVYLCVCILRPKVDVGCLL